MNNPPAPPLRPSGVAGAGHTGFEQLRRRTEQRGQEARHQGGDAPWQNGGVQYGGRIAPQGQQYGQNGEFGPPPPPPRRYNVWGMDYSPYDEGGPFAGNRHQNADYCPPPPPPPRYNVRGMDNRPYDQGGQFAEQSRTDVPQSRQHGQDADYGPPPPPPKRYNVWGMDYGPSDQVGLTAHQSHEVRSPVSSGAPHPPREPYDGRGMNYRPDRPGGHGGEGNRR